MNYKINYNLKGGSGNIVWNNKIDYVLNKKLANKPNSLDGKQYEYYKCDI